jgi:hypothetical protein
MRKLLTHIAVSLVRWQNRDRRSDLEKTLDALIPSFQAMLNSTIAIGDKSKIAEASSALQIITDYGFSKYN